MRESQFKSDMDAEKVLANLHLKKYIPNALTVYPEDFVILNYLQPAR